MGLFRKKYNTELLKQHIELIHDLDIVEIQRQHKIQILINLLQKGSIPFEELNIIFPEMTNEEIKSYIRQFLDYQSYIDAIKVIKPKELKTFSNDYVSLVTNEYGLNEIRYLRNER